MPVRLQTRYCSQSKFPWVSSLIGPYAPCRLPDGMIRRRNAPYVQFWNSLGVKRGHLAASHEVYIQEHGIGLYICNSNACSCMLHTPISFSASERWDGMECTESLPMPRMLDQVRKFDIYTKRSKLSRRGEVAAEPQVWFHPSSGCHQEDMLQHSELSCDVIHQTINGVFQS